MIHFMNSAMDDGSSPPPSAQRSGARRSLREENRAAVREAILNAATSIFGNQGFQAAKMTDIAQEAGVAAGTLYNYFESKEEIFGQIVARVCTKLEDELERTNLIAAPLERLRALLQLPLVVIESQGPLAAIQFEMTGIPDIDLGTSAADLDVNGARTPDERVRRLHCGLLRQAIIAAQDEGSLRDGSADAMLLMLCGIIKSLIWTWLQGERASSLSAQTDFVFDLFLNGAKRHDAAS
jgi:AcrR family transcriptional regulator